MNYLTRDDLLDLHTFAVERFGGRLGIRSQDRLLATVAAPQQVLFGAELYPDLASKTAIVGFMMLKNRPFNSGNEATALLALLRMLVLNGRTVDRHFADKLALVLRSVLNSERDQDDLATWLRDELADPTGIERSAS